MSGSYATRRVQEVVNQLNELHSILEACHLNGVALDAIQLMQLDQACSNLLGKLKAMEAQKPSKEVWSDPDKYERGTTRYKRHRYGP